MCGGGGGGGGRCTDLVTLVLFWSIALSDHFYSFLFVCFYPTNCLVGWGGGGG